MSRRIRFISFRLGWCAVLAVLVGGSEILRAAQPGDLIAHLAAIEAQHQALCPLSNGTPPLPDRLGSLLQRMPAAEKGGQGTVEALNRLVFHDLAIQPSNDLKDPCNLLPSAVIERKRGYCVGIAALYLVLAERLGLPVHAVATPSHVFLRYDDGTTRIRAGGATGPLLQHEMFRQASPWSIVHVVRADPASHAVPALLQWSILQRIARAEVTLRSVSAER